MDPPARRSDLDRAPVRGRVAGRGHGDRARLHQPPPVRVVDGDDLVLAAPVEQQRLGREVARPCRRWKSRWSWDRLVNAPAVNRVPSTRPSASAWLDTSIATAVTPRSAIAANGRLQVGRLGRGADARHRLAGHPGLDRADQPGACGRRPAAPPPAGTPWWSCRWCRSRRARACRRSGRRRPPRPARRAAPAGRSATSTGSPVGGGQLGPGRVGEHRGGAGRRGRAGEPGTVRAGARKRREKVTGVDGGRVVRDAR